VSNETRLRVAVVGAGKIGTRRTIAIAANSRSEIRVVADQVLDTAKKLAGIVGCSDSADSEKRVTRKDVDAIIVSTSPERLSTVAHKALAVGKHLLCESLSGETPMKSVRLSRKPLGVTSV
jgi:predicted dehydrogenase